MVDWEEKRAAARQAALEAGFGPRDADILAELSRPAARLADDAASDVALGASKIGGRPDLPAEVEWPRGRWGAMLFCGQVALADAAFLAGVDGWGPETGLLSFFADKEPGSWETAGGRVLRLPDDGLERQPRPDDLAGDAHFEERPLEVIPVLSPPEAAVMCVGTAEFTELDYDLDADDWAAWSAVYESLVGTASPVAGHHQLLGNAWCVGGIDPVWAGCIRLLDPGEEEDTSRFRLLAQFTSDQSANIEIGDMGALYFVMSAEDLSAQRFDRVAVHVEA